MAPRKCPHGTLTQIIPRVWTLGGSGTGSLEGLGAGCTIRGPPGRHFFPGLVASHGNAVLVDQQP